MAYKIYLSPAAHATDNKTKCVPECGENVHANLYMDLVEKRLKECGFSVKRGSKKLTGSAAMTARVREANKWGADLYYVAHTNAGGGRYSVTYCYPNTGSKAIAATFGKFRKALESYNGYKWRCKTNKALYEINSTAAPCLYDELFFHDNAADCAWFHDGGMEELAEEAVAGICAIFGVAYKPDEPVEYKPGKKLALNNADVYRTATWGTPIKKTGTYYVYSDGQKNGRIPITNKARGAGKKPSSLYIIGWIEV